MKLNRQEIATILAALRNLQEITTPEAGNDARELYPEIFADVDPLDSDAIGELCERINCGG